MYVRPATYNMILYIIALLSTWYIFHNIQCVQYIVTISIILTGSAVECFHIAAIATYLLIIEERVDNSNIELNSIEFAINWPASRNSPTRILPRMHICAELKTNCGRCRSRIAVFDS